MIQEELKYIQRDMQWLWRTYTGNKGNIGDNRKQRNIKKTQQQMKEASRKIKENTGNIKEIWCKHNGCMKRKTQWLRMKENWISIKDIEREYDVNNKGVSND